MDINFLLAAAAGYILGSIPFGLVLTRLAGLGDIREIGSGNIGATNVLRTGNKPLAFLTLISDSGKGAAAAVVMGYYLGMEAGLVSGFAAVIGHNFPVWLRFKGGKGVATTLGVLLVTAWPVGVATCLTWVVTAAIFRISSLSAIVALGLSPAFAWWLATPAHAILAVALAVLSIARHHENIGRILRGEESRIGKKKPT